MKTKFTRRVALAIAASAALMTAAPAVASDWKPQKPIEMVIMAGQGGGADRLARLFQSIIDLAGEEDGENDQDHHTPDIYQ